jgi:hypothetical protein
MAGDITATSATDFYNLATTIPQNLLNINANQQAAQQMAAAYNQAGNYISTAQQTATGYQQPYLQTGTNALSGLATANANVGTPLSMADFQSGVYGQVANSAQKTAADQLKATAGAAGTYGSGNMANAMQQNAMNTQLGYYDTANKQNLSQQQASLSGYYNTANMGATAGANMGNQTMDSSKYLAALAQAQGISQTKTTAQQAAFINSMIAGLGASGALGAAGGLVKSAWGKMQSGDDASVTPDEKAAFDNFFTTHIANTADPSSEINSLTNSIDSGSYYNDAGTLME